MNPLPADRSANLLLWVVMWTCLFGWLAVSRAVDRLPTLGDLVRMARRYFFTRWLLLLWWAWLGWHLFVRTTY